MSFRDKWVPVIKVWRVLRLRMQKRPPDIQGRCEYVEKAVKDNRQGVVLKLGSWAGC
jgi:hypothetical protein